MECMKQSEKSKQESSPWVKRKKKPGPKKKKDSIEEAKKIRLAASDKGSWYNQSELLSTSSNACETGKEVGASSSKIYSSRRVQSEEEDWNTDSTQSESESSTMLIVQIHWLLLIGSR